METKREMINAVAGKQLRAIGLIQVLFLLAFVASIFIWIWHSWDLAWRIGLTGIVGVLICKVIHWGTLKTVSAEIDKIIKENNPPKKSNFQERLEEMAIQRNSKL